jgi:tetratricopeptide (TPR) repeat protein
MSLAYIRHNLGCLHVRARRLKEAEQAFRGALEIKKPLAEANPSPKYQADLALTYQNLGNICLQTRRLKEAAEHYEVAANLFEVVRDVPRYRESLLQCRNNRGIVLGHLGRHAEALREWDRGLPLAAGRRRLAFRCQRALTLGRLKKADEAIAAADDLLRTDGRDRAALDAAARAYALASAAESGAVKERYAARAVELLRKADEKEPVPPEYLEKHPDLKTLRGRDDFKKHLGDLKARRPKGPA